MNYSYQTPEETVKIMLDAIRAITKPRAIEVNVNGKAWIPVSTLGEASTLCRAYIEQHMLGASMWRGGAVRRIGERRRFATVSYNGRVWHKLGDTSSEITGNNLHEVYR